MVDEKGQGDIMCKAQCGLMHCLLFANISVPETRQRKTNAANELHIFTRTMNVIN